MYSLIVSLSSLFGLIVCHSSDATIGNYSQYIPDYELCGLSMRLYQSSTKCFKYHRNMESPIRGGREAYDGEVPWSVELDIWFNYPWYKLFNVISPYEMCTGTIIDKQWILTAAHCFEPIISGKVKGFEVKVWFGPIHSTYLTDKTIPGTNKPNGIKTMKPIIHPLYSQDNDIDVALLQLEEPVPISHIDHNYITNIICLPEKTNTLKRDLLSFNSGWGSEDRTDRIKVGTRIMSGTLINSEANVLKEPVLYVQYVPPSYGDKGSPCSGDSGSGVWQYVDGRAVIIGVLRGKVIIPGEYPEDCTKSQSYGPYIPKFIDWILQTIANSTQP